MALESIKPRLALTMGDPRGIGPELIAKSLATLSEFSTPCIFGHRDLLGIDLDPYTIIEPKDCDLKDQTAENCGRVSLDFISDAYKAISDGTCDAMVTGPICKAHIHAAGSPHQGHTELLAALAGVKKTFLMMVGPHLRVSLVTLHVPLMELASLLTTELIIDAIFKTDHALRHCFGVEKPRIGLAGLNPHAGEQGLFGCEEMEVMQPAVDYANKKGLDVTGPLPGDTIFYQALQGDFDVVVSTYHDQGLIPIKLLDFDRAVNMTLGLPFIRTSVDHGVAFDIVGQNKANPSSLIEAAKLAAKMVKGEGYDT